MFDKMFSYKLFYSVIPMILTRRNQVQHVFFGIVSSPIKLSLRQNLFPKGIWHGLFLEKAKF